MLHKTLVQPIYISPMALDNNMRSRAPKDGNPLFTAADATTYAPTTSGYDLVMSFLTSYLGVHVTYLRPIGPPPQSYKHVGLYSHGDTKSTGFTPQDNQVIPDQIQPTFITGVNLFSVNSAVDKTIIGKYYCDIANICPLILNTKLRYHNLIGPKKYYDYINLSLKASIKNTTLILPVLYKVSSKNTLLYILFPMKWNHLQHKYDQTYLIMGTSLSKSIPNSTQKDTEPLTYKFLQILITVYAGWVILNNFLQ